MDNVNSKVTRMDNLGERIRLERERLGLSQTEVGEVGGVKKNAQHNYETGKRQPDAAYLAAISKIGVDVLYVLTGVRADPSLAEPAPDPLEPLKFMICADLVAQEYQSAGIDLPPMARKIEALWAYDELISRMADPSDGDEMEAVLPHLRHLLRKRLLETAA